MAKKVEVQDIVLDKEVSAEVVIPSSIKSNDIVFLHANRRSSINTDKIVKEDEECNTLTYGAERYDINKMVELYTKQGYSEQDFITMAQNIRNAGTYVDISGLQSFSDIQDRMEQVAGYFSHVPADVRAKFNNDPYQFFHWASDPNNERELVGYLRKSRNLNAFPEVSPVATPVAPAKQSDEGK